MAKNHNIQSFSQYLSSAGYGRYAVIGDQVADGMKRYVTFIRVEPMMDTNNEGSKVFFISTPLVSGAIACGSATFAQKMVILLASTSTVGHKGVAVPASPSTEHPLFTVASAAYLRALLSTANTMSSSVQIFVQYFDE